MCQPFIFYHLCGHIHSKQIWKCSNEVERQLDLAKSEDTAPDAPVHPTFISAGACLDSCDSEPYLKPTLCGKCEEGGVITDWLKSDPAMRYEIVREWLQSKRAAKGGFEDRADSESVLAAEKADSETASSVSGAESAQTPPTTGTPKKLTITIPDTDFHDIEAAEQLSPLPFDADTKLAISMSDAAEDAETYKDALSIMTPVLTDYLFKAEEVEAEVHAVERKVQERCMKLGEEAVRADSLRGRAAAVHQKLAALIAENKKRPAAIE